MGDQARAAKAAIYKMRAPPRMPHTYMSRAYPIYEDKKNLADDTDRAPVYMQFRLVQQEEQRQDLARILCNKDVKYMEFRLKNQHLSNYCDNICPTIARSAVSFRSGGAAKCKLSDTDILLQASRTL